jgi:hypothetical protein
MNSWHSAKAEVARCLFCGAVGVWWECHCPSGQKIRDGKLPRPRTVIRNGVPIIECCAELREAARHAGVIKMAPERDGVTASVTDSVTQAPASVTPALSVTGERDSGTLGVTETATDRQRRLARERQQRKREKGRE